MLRLIFGLLDLIVPAAWGLSMIALPIGFVIMLFGGGGTVFLNAALVAAITSIYLIFIKNLGRHMRKLD